MPRHFGREGKVEFNVALETESGTAHIIVILECGIDLIMNKLLNILMRELENIH